MAGRYGSMYRSIVSAVRSSSSSTSTSSPTLRRLRPGPNPLCPPRCLGQVGFAQSLLTPLNGAAAATRLAQRIPLMARAYFELSQGS